MRIALQLPWNPASIDAFIATARAADAAGVHSLWVHEGFGHDAFSGLTILARETRDVRLGTSIVNVWSRTPGALAQQFATLDQLGGGRILIGLGASGPGAIERFHGQPFLDPLGRLRETVELLRRYWARERFSYAGSVARLVDALPLGVEPVQPAPPVFLATLAPASVRLTATLADGWLPALLPFDRLSAQIAAFRDLAVRAGRDAAALQVRSPGRTIVVERGSDVPSLRRQLAAELAFTVARNGDFYYRQLVRNGLGAEADAIRAAWAAGGQAAAAEAAGEALAARFTFVGERDACIAHLRRQQAAGVDIHVVAVHGDGPPGEVLRALAEA